MNLGWREGGANHELRVGGENLLTERRGGGEHYIQLRKGDVWKLMEGRGNLRNKCTLYTIVDTERDTVLLKNKVSDR